MYVGVGFEVDEQGNRIRQFLMPLTVAEPLWAILAQDEEFWRSYS